MKNNEFKDFCELVLKRLPTNSPNLLLQIYSSWRLKLMLSAYQIYRPTIMNIGALYHQYQRNRYEKLIGCLPSDTNINPLDFYIEKFEAHDFATKYGRAYKKEYRDWCLEKAKEENISPVHLPFLIWNGDLNPRNKSFLKGTKEIIILQGFCNFIFTLMMLNGLFLVYLSDNKPLFLKIKLAAIVCLVTMLGWTFYNPYSIGLYKVAKNYSKRSY